MRTIIKIILALIIIVILLNSCTVNREIKINLDIKKNKTNICKNTNK